jgi:hypothetical protein
MADSMKGGAFLQKRLQEIAKNISKPGALRVGFLEDATYEDGTQVSYISAIQEFVGTYDHPGGTSYTIGKDGMATFRKKDFEGPVSGVTGKHQITIPARPYFRTMIQAHKGEWGDQLGKVIVANNYDAEKSMGLMGEVIKGELQESIGQLTSPPLAPSTVKKKGFDKPLIDTGHMQNSVDYDVKS